MISAIVLAAGRSERMGEQKLLLPLGGKAVITRVVDEVLAGSVSEVLVVTGQDRPGIEQALEGRRVQFVVNPDARGDMLSSVRCGLRAVSRQADSVLVALGDQPGISRDVMAKLVQAFEGGAGRIVVPTYQGKRGHPLLLSTGYRDEILRSFDQVGLRGLLQAHLDDVFELDVSDPEVLDDMDLPSDYQRICRAYRDSRQNID
jgi:molybdenum cofactor cytidylyltransferase